MVFIRPTVLRTAVESSALTADRYDYIGATNPDVSFEEYPTLTSKGFTKYTVALSDMEMIFFQSEKSNRWWLEITNDSYLNNKNKTTALLPCTHKDYLDACNVCRSWCSHAHQDLTRAAFD